MDVEQFLRLKKSRSLLNEQKSKLQGAREILLERLKKEFQSSSVMEAKLLLNKIEMELAEKEKFYQKEYYTIEKELSSK